MKLFIGWSGTTSGRLALALRDWVKTVHQNIQPWCSEKDIGKGQPWGSEIASELRDSNAGILCLTSTNLTSPWLHFEAGALSKLVDRARVCTYLFDVSDADVREPLGFFQATKAEKADTLQLLKNLNGDMVSGQIEEAVLETSFEALWESFEQRLSEIRSTGADRPRTPPSRQEELLEEIFRRVKDFDPKFDDLNKRVRRLLGMAGTRWPRPVEHSETSSNAAFEELERAHHELIATTKQVEMFRDVSAVVEPGSSSDLELEEPEPDPV
jgi:hypothetical protein